LALLTARTKGKEGDAIALYTEVYTQSPKSPRAPEAMFAKAEVQGRLKLRDVDPTLSVPVPRELLTYRELAERYPRAAAAEHALFRVAGMYEDLRRYDLAAQAYEKLGAGFPESHYDGWFRAGEVYERRLKDGEKARAAYLQVPASSPRYKDAQKRAAK
jgi:TolA-binding protein